MCFLNQHRISDSLSLFLTKSENLVEQIFFFIQVSALWILTFSSDLSLDSIPRSIFISLIFRIICTNIYLSKLAGDQEPVVSGLVVWVGLASVMGYGLLQVLLTLAFSASQSNATGAVDSGACIPPG